MTLADLFMTLETRQALPRAKDCKTALRLLAEALGAPSWEQCPVEDACRQEARWAAALDAHFERLQAKGRTMGSGYRRNIKSNLRKVFEVAEAHGLLAQALPLVLLTPTTRRVFERQHRDTSPYQITYRQALAPENRYGLAQAQWPPDIAQGWRIWRATCRLRETTVESYRYNMETYLGYLAHIAQVQPQWADVFDQVRLAEFVRWHAARHQCDLTVHGLHVVMNIAAMAKLLAHPHARALADYRNALTKQGPHEVHNKRADAWVPLAQLEAVAQACLAEGRLPGDTDPRTTCQGLRRVHAFQRGVMLALLVRLPLRSRNVREIQLGKHLYQDHEGHWQLAFRGSDLKIGTRGGRPNTYQVDLTDYEQRCPGFLPVLEEFVQDFRPRLPNPRKSPFLFLSRYGNPYSVNSLGVELSSCVARHTGKRWHPHLVRDVWATEFIDATGDYHAAATMLGDTVEVVLATYYQTDRAKQQAKAQAFLSGAIKPKAS